MKYFVKPRYKTAINDRKFVYGRFSVYEDLDVMLSDIKTKLLKGLMSGDALLIELAEGREPDKKGGNDG